ncbi:MAG: TetR/AcrR family transcriptional regulator [Candidatus Thiodiazotropha sp.]
MSAGRKRTFDKSDALDKAMRVFWRNGYSGTSVTDLTEALGINKPSLYAAFGNKEQLFGAALEHYSSHYGAPILERLTEPPEAPVTERIRAYMLGITDLVSNKALPKGCFIVKSNCEAGGSAIPDEISLSLHSMRSAHQQALRKVVETEQKRGLLQQTDKAGDIAEYLLSVLYGISVLARQGKSRKELLKVVDIAINALPLPVR